MKKCLKNLCLKDSIPFSITVMQFGFRHQYSTSHALINITENIRKALSDANIGCRVFVDLQKAFDTDTVSKIAICEVPNDWYKSYV